jgi:hypothetical protein
MFPLILFRKDYRVNKNKTDFNKTINNYHTSLTERKIFLNFEALAWSLKMGSNSLHFNFGSSLNKSSSRFVQCSVILNKPSSDNWSFRPPLKSSEVKEWPMCCKTWNKMSKLHIYIYHIPMLNLRLHKNSIARPWIYFFGCNLLNTNIRVLEMP